MSKGWVTAHEETFPVVKLPEVPRCCPVLTSNSGFGIAFALLSCPLLARVWSRDAITWGLLSKASCTNWSKVKTVFVWVCVCAHNEWEKQLTAAMRASWITRFTAIKLGPTVFHQKTGLAKDSFPLRTGQLCESKPVCRCARPITRQATPQNR